MLIDMILWYIRNFLDHNVKLCHQYLYMLQQLMDFLKEFKEFKVTKLHFMELHLNFNRHNYTKDLQFHHNQHDHI